MKPIKEYFSSTASGIGNERCLGGRKKAKDLLLVGYMSAAGSLAVCAWILGAFGTSDFSFKGFFFLDELCFFWLLQYHKEAYNSGSSVLGSPVMASNPLVMVLISSFK